MSAIRITNQKNIADIETLLTSLGIESITDTAIIGGTIGGTTSTTTITGNTNFGATNSFQDL